MNYKTNINYLYAREKIKFKYIHLTSNALEGKTPYAFEWIMEIRNIEKQKEKNLDTHDEVDC